MINKIKKELEIISNNFIHLQQQTETISCIAKSWINAIENGNKIIFCGNGGSAADAQHLSTELMGKYKIIRNPLPAISLTVNTSAITAISNDYGFEKIFSNQLQGIGNKGDVLVGISTSGNSQNIIEAFKIAKERKITTIAFTGQSGGKMIKLADITLNVPSDITNNIQEMHIASGHIICEIVESYFFDKNNYK